MELERIDELIAVYRDGLLKDTLPFWLRHAVDKEHGGFMFAVDRDGTRLDTDKGMWQHGRFTWLLATLDRELHGTEHWQPTWLETAKHPGISRHPRYRRVERVVKVHSSPNSCPKHRALIIFLGRRCTMVIQRKSMTGDSSPN